MSKKQLPRLHPEIAEMVRHIVKKKQREFERRGAIRQSFTVINLRNGHATEIEARMDSDRTKDATAAVVRRLAEDEAADLIVAVLEVWMASARAEEGEDREAIQRRINEGPRPSERPDREEKIVVIVEQAGSHVLFFLDIQRKAVGYQTFDLPDFTQIDPIEADGRFTHMLPVNDKGDHDLFAIPLDLENPEDAALEYIREMEKQGKDVAKKMAEGMVALRQREGDENFPRFYTGSMSAFAHFVAGASTFQPDVNGETIFMGCPVYEDPRVPEDLVVNVIPGKLVMVQDMRSNANWTIAQADLPGLPEKPAIADLVQAALRAAGRAS